MNVLLDAEWLKDLASHIQGASQTGAEAHRELRCMAREMLVACMSGRLIRAICDDCGIVRYGDPATQYYVYEGDKLRCPQCHHLRQARLAAEEKASWAASTSIVMLGSAYR